MNSDHALQQPADIARQCCDLLPLPAVRDDGPIFAEPWQAHAFAMAVQLHERGLFTWPEWAAALTAEIRAGQAAALTAEIRAGQAAGQTDAGNDDGSLYYTHWLNALEKLVIARQVGTPEQIHALEHAWEAAAGRTPHGQPIVLEPVDLLPIK